MKLREGREDEGKWSLTSFTHATQRSCHQFGSVQWKHSQVAVLVGGTQSDNVAGA